MDPQKQYLRQLWAGGGLKNQVNSAQTGNLLKDLYHLNKWGESLKPTSNQG